jgi:Zn-dependent peptidase ImmA (M78 family)
MPTPLPVTVTTALCAIEGARKTIWHNDGHALVRQRSNLAHELAHALLFHTPGSDTDPVHARPWDRTAEDEAQWLGGALLVSNEAAFALAYAGTDTITGANRYGVSTDMLVFRLNVTGALIRAARSKQRRRSAER